MESGKKQNVWIAIVVGVGVLLMVSQLLLQMQKQSKTRTIYFGMFAGNYWDVPDGNCYEVVDEAIRQFEEKHPGVQVEYVSGILKEDYPEWLAEQILLGSEPDVFMIPAGEFDTIASLRALKNLDGLIREDSGFDSGRYYSGAYQYGNIRDIQYALPYESVPTLMFVNKSLLDKEQIPMPDADWSWNNFIDICRQVTRDTDGDGVVDQFGSFDYGWKDAVCANGVVLFEENGTVSHIGDQQVEAAVRFVKDLNGVSEGYQVTAKEFDKGNVAFRPFAFSEYKTYKPYPWRIKKYSDFEWECIKMPAGPEGSGQSELKTLLMGISSRTKEEALAWELLKELCYSVETQMRLLKDSQGMPVLREVAESELFEQILGDDTPGNSSLDADVVRQVMEEAVGMPNFRLYPAAMSLADSEINRMIQGDVSLDNGLLKLQREMNSLLQQ